MLLYAITSRNLLPGTESQRQAALVDLARRWARADIAYIQIREKDLAPSVLLALAARIVTAVRAENTSTRVLVNGPSDIALAAEADGVHLPASTPADAASVARQAFQSAGREAIVSRACHTLEEIRATGEVSLLVFAPVFEKAADPGTNPTESPAPAGIAGGTGLDVLREACRAAAPTPVIALGGVTASNAPACMAAGAAGVAGIRMFLSDDWRKLRSL